MAFSEKKQKQKQTKKKHSTIAVLFLSSPTMALSDKNKNIQHDLSTMSIYYHNDI